MWKCIRCEKENPDSAENCTECGHARSMDYSHCRVLSRVSVSVTDHWKVDKNSPEYLARQGREYLEKAVELFEKANVNKADEPTRELFIRLSNCLGCVNINGAGERKETQTESSKPVLMADENTNKVFGRQNISRESIREIEFVKLDKGPLPDDAWDVSANKRKEIWAWIENTEHAVILKIASRNGVHANPNCHNLFAGYTNVRKIEFNNLFDTSNVTDMSQMFCGCRILKEVDVRNFNTDKVMDVQRMFASCRNLVRPNAADFKFHEGTLVQGMFEDSGLTRNFSNVANDSSKRMKKTLKVLNSDTPQFRQYNKAYRGNSIEEICKTFLSDKENSDINTVDNGKLRKTLKIAEEEAVYILHDDSWFGRGKNGFAITEKGIYNCELLEHANFVPWEEFQDCTEIEGIKVKLKEKWSVLTYISVGAVRIEILLISIHKFLNQ